MNISASKLAYSIVATALLAIGFLAMMVYSIFEIDEQYQVEYQATHGLMRDVSSVSNAVGMSQLAAPNYFPRLFRGSTVVLLRSAEKARLHGWLRLERLLGRTGVSIKSWEHAHLKAPDSEVVVKLRTQVALQLGRSIEEVQEISNGIVERNTRNKSHQFKVVIIISLVLLALLVITSLFFFVALLRPLGRVAQKIHLHEPLAPAARGGLLVSEIRDFLGVIDDSRTALSHQANHDALTGLPNRTLLSDYLQRNVANCQRHGGTCAVFFIDLDDFKTINDSLGHAIGDLMLISLASRLTLCLRGSDILSRLGGDEFTVLVADPGSTEDIARFADKIMDIVMQPHEIDGHQLSVNASIGIAIYPADGDDHGALMRNADAALYRAKLKGKGGYHFYTPELTLQADRKLTLERELKRAMLDNQLTLYYQPQVDMETGQIVGMEALIRWQHPENGLLDPIAFLPVAEESLLIVSIGDWVIERACQQIRKWIDAGLIPVTVSINISSAQFSKKQFVELVEDTLMRYRLEPSMLALELTETTLLKGQEQMADIMQRLRVSGVEIVIDDFGTGYSSMQYLQQLPVDTIKIDQSFVQNIMQDPTIVDAIILIAKGVGLNLVAEGVEEQAQADYLLQQGCRFAQGYHYHRPMPPERMEAQLRGWVSIEG